MINSFFVFITLTIIYISAIAVAAQLSSIGVREVSLGYGKELFSSGIFKVRLILVGGFVKLVDTRDSEYADVDQSIAINHKPLVTQILVILSGVLVLLFISFLIIGSDTMTSTFKGVEQLIIGTMSPFDKAQHYLSEVSSFISNNGFLYTLAVAATKLCALNLLPFSVLSGGQALITLFKLGKPEATWEKSVLQWLFWPVLLLQLSWFVAIIYYLWSKIS